MRTILSQLITFGPGFDSKMTEQEVAATETDTFMGSKASNAF